MNYTKAPVVADALYTVPEAATLLSMHPKTLRRKLSYGVLSGKRRGGGHWRIRGTELLRLA